ncbi:MAG: sigma-B regulation protein RsbU (phosphoserine phosphatase) [Cellvibrionaceae bacterium]|jgi:sigma-B regulation protein RsbU (phosphoserine phosphatase)
MLDQIGLFYQEDLERLADIWLTAGAESFGLRTSQHLVAHWPETVGSQAAVSAPIYLEGKTIGEVFVTGLCGDWVQSQLESNAIAISRFVLQEQEMESLTQELVNNQDQLIALYDLLHSTRKLVSITEIVDGIVQAVGQIYDVSTAFIKVIFPDRNPILAMHPQPFSECLIDALVEKSLTHLDYFLWDKTLMADSDGSDQIDTMLGIPLKMQDETLAVLGVINNRDGDFESPDIKLLGAIGKYVESEIENALMHEANVERVKAQTRLDTEMALAHEVQMRLMPQTLPAFSTLDLAAMSLPALSVGGDFYDCLVQSEQNFYFTLGDVSGKGMSAALLMAMTRTTMRNIARLLQDSRPQIILDRTTEALYDDFTEVRMFVTVFVGVFCSQNEELHYANAGHAPVIYRPAGGVARLLEATGPPLGTWPENLAPEATIAFGIGDLLVAATDGLNEARNSAGEMFEIERLLQLVDELAHQSSHEILDRLLNAVSTFSHGEPQDDDQTVLVLKRDPCK